MKKCLTHIQIYMSYTSQQMYLQNNLYSICYSLKYILYIISMYSLYLINLTIYLYDIKGNAFYYKGYKKKIKKYRFYIYYQINQNNNHQYSLNKLRNLYIIGKRRDILCIFQELRQLNNIQLHMKNNLFYYKQCNLKCTVCMFHLQNLNKIRSHNLYKQYY